MVHVHFGVLRSCNAVQKHFGVMGHLQLQPAKFAMGLIRFLIGALRDVISALCDLTSGLGDSKLCLFHVCFSCFSFLSVCSRYLRSTTMYASAILRQALCNVRAECSVRAMLAQRCSRAGECCPGNGARLVFCYVGVGMV